MSEEKLTKEEMFAKDPDQFIHLSELVIAVKTSEEEGQALMTYVGQNHSEIVLRGSAETLKEKVAEYLYHRKMQAHEASKLIKDVQGHVNKNNMRNFLRKK